MNSYSGNATYRSTQNTPTAAQESLEQIIPVMGGVVLLYAFISIVIFIIWIWSMVSMISLNKRFKEFFDTYTLNQENNTTGNTYVKENQQASESREQQKYLDESNQEGSEKSAQDHTSRKQGGTIKLLILAVLLIVLGMIVAPFI